MSDMNFLNSAPSDAVPKKDDDKKPAQAGDLSFHVPAAPAPTPAPKPPAPAAPPAPKKDEGLKTDASLASLKVPAGKLQEPVLPKVKPSSPIAPPIAPPKPPVAAKPLPISNGAPSGPAPAPVSPTAPPANANGRDTLRVSLISAGGEGGLSELTVRERVRKLWEVAALFLVIDAAIFGAIFWYRTVVERQVATVQQSLDAVNAQVAKAEADTKPAKDLQTLLVSADQALRQHKHWTKVLAMLEELVKPEVVLSGITLSDQGSLATTITAPDYLTIAQQILVFRNDPRVKSVPYVGAAKGGNSVSTGLSLQFNPSVLTDDTTGTPAR